MMSHIIKIIFTLLLFLMCHNSVAAINLSPPPDQNEIKVNIGLYIDDIANVNEKNEIIEFELRLYLKWFDKRLVFPSTSNETKHVYRGDAAIDKLKTIWSPPYSFPQSRDETKLKEIQLMIMSDGNVILLQRFCGQIESKLDMRRFPFDIQQLDIRVGQMLLSEPNVIFVEDPKYQGFSGMARLPEWEILKYTSQISDNGKLFTYTISLQHNSKFYLYRVFLPLIIIIFLSWVVLWVPGQRLINRLQFVLTALLAILIFQWVILNDIPRVSYPTFFGEVFFFSFMTLAVTIFTLVIDTLLAESLSNRILFHMRWFIPLFYLLGLLTIIIYNYVWL